MTLVARDNRKWDSTVKFRAYFYIVNQVHGIIVYHLGYSRQNLEYYAGSVSTKPFRKFIVGRRWRGGLSHPLFHQ